MKRYISLFISFVISVSLLQGVEVHAQEVDGLSDSFSDSVLDEPESEDLPEAPIDCEADYSDGNMAIVGDAASYYQSGAITINGSPVSKMTQQQIKTEYDAFLTNFASIQPTPYYTQTPSAVAPYAEGQVSDSYLNNTLAFLNYARHLAGLPVVELNSTLNSSAQKGAVLSAANDGISHSPGKPDNMSASFFKEAANACAWSNLYCTKGASVPPVLTRSVGSFLDDYNSAANLSALGHRRWVLYPYLKRTGIGLGTKGSTTAAVLRVTKGSEDSVDPKDTSQSVDYDFISWPSSGNFPVDYSHEIYNFAKTMAPWSVTLNPAKYSIPKVSAIKVTVTRESDNKKWVLDGSDSSVAKTPAKGGYKNKYLVVNTDGYGIANAIIFSLGSDSLESQYNKGDASNQGREELYSVKISGLKTKSGADTAIAYQVNFFDVQHPNVASPYYNSTLSVNAIPAGGDPDAGGDDGDDEVTDPELEATEVIDIGVNPDLNMEHVITFCRGPKKTPRYTQYGGKVESFPDYSLYGNNTGMDISDTPEGYVYSASESVPDGYYFAGWYTAEDIDNDGKLEYNKKVTADTRFTEDTTVWAKLVEYEEGVSPKDVSSAVIKIKDQTYDGTPKTPAPAVSVGGKKLVENIDYIVAYNNNLDASTNGKVANVTISGIGNYKGSATASFKIKPKSIKKANIWFEPCLIVGNKFSTNSIRGHYTDNGLSLVYGVDYTAASNQKGTLSIKKGIGTYTYVIEGKGNYSGVVSKKIKCYSLSAQDTDYNALTKKIVSASKSGAVLSKSGSYDAVHDAYYYTGSPIKPSVTIAGLSSSDYKVKYKNNKLVGTATAEIIGDGKYKGQSYTLYYRIIGVDIANAKIDAIPNGIFKTKPLVPKINGTCRVGAKDVKIKPKKDYIAVCENNWLASNQTQAEASVELMGQGNFAGIKKLSFTVKSAK